MKYIYTAIHHEADLIIEAEDMISADKTLCFLVKDTSLWRFLSKGDE